MASHSFTHLQCTPKWNSGALNIWFFFFFISFHKLRFDLVVSRAGNSLFGLIVNNIDMDLMTRITFFCSMCVTSS